MKKNECTCGNDCDCDLEYCDCDCDFDSKSKLIKIGACVGGIALLGGVIAALVIRNKKRDY